MYGQKNGTYLTADDPLVKHWQFMGEPEDAAPIAGKKQFAISLLQGELPSLMTSKYEGECLTTCKISKDDKSIYLAITEACEPSISEAEKYIKIGYSIGGVKSIRTIEINGNTTSIEEMKPVLTLVIDGTTYHYQQIEAE